MEESPRASKRRKLDTSRPAASSPIAKSSTARKSSRLANKPVVHPKTVAENADIWDDIEAASGEGNVMSTTTTKRRTLATKSNQSRGKVGESNEPDELHVAKPTAGSSRKSITPRRSKPKTGTAGLIVNGSMEDVEAQADTSDELGHSTPAGKRTTSSARKTASIRRSRDIKQLAATRGGETEVSTATPLRSGRRKQSRFQEDDIIPETTDQADPVPHSSNLRERAHRRRRLHRADHISNEDAEILVNVEDGFEQNTEEGDGDAMSVDGNSMAGSILDPTEPSPFNKPSPAQKSDHAPPQLTIHLEAGRELDLLKTIVLERVAGRRPAPLVNLDEEYASVHQVMHQTITAGEGNSMLVIGARGSGKTSLVNKALAEVHKENGEDYHVVRLNGFIHTDDKIALREIWRQLGKEMELEEDGGGVGKNYADTLTTLLALLSHPSEQTGEETDHTARAVIFVMDEFDLFAQHARQTLLYNLFDIAQSRKAPIAVLGLTTRIDVANSLEKRVKSRFSHRYVHLSLAKTFSAFQDMCKANLLIHTDQLSIPERSILEKGVNSPAKRAKGGSKPTLLSEWNKNITTLFASKSFLTSHLAPTYHLTKSIPELLTTFLLPTATLSPSTSTLQRPSTNSLPPTSKLYLIPHLSTLALSLLIAAARLDIIHDSDTCNFNMAYDEYVTLASKARIQNGVGGVSVGGSMSKVWSKEVARLEWEGLVELGFMLPVLLGTVGGFGMVKVDVALEEIGSVLRGPAGKTVEKGLERWCRQI